MGCASSTLVVQEPTEKPLIADAIGVDASLVLASIGQAVSPLKITYKLGDAFTGKSMIQQVRNHFPNQAVPAEQASNLPFTGAIASAAVVEFKDAAGNTSALLKCRHGETNKKINGANLSISQSAGEGGVALSFGGNPYIQGRGSSVLYGPSRTVVGFTVADEPAVDSTAVEAVADVSDPDGDGFTNKLGEIKPICTVDEAAARGFSRASTGGLGFFPAHPDGSIAGTASLILKVHAFGKITNQDGQLVATCSDWTISPSTAGPKKITIAAGVDAVLVAALISEWDANRYKNRD